MEAGEIPRQSSRGQGRERGREPDRVRGPGSEDPSHVPRAVRRERRAGEDGRLQGPRLNRADLHRAHGITDARGHGHEHDPDDEGRVATEQLTLRTVGIDIGTTTSHLIFSELLLERQGIRLSSADSVVRRRVVHRSEVTLTPYSSPRRIDTEALSRLIARAYDAAGWTPEAIDTGAVIATGEAARKENAPAIVSLFSGQAGRFVCGTARHHLEALLAAHGSGAVARSRDPETPLVLNVDIGGGNTKLAVCRAGRVDETAAIDVGARVVWWDDIGNIRGVTEAGERLFPVGASPRIGAASDRALLERVADAVAAVVMSVPEGRPIAATTWLTEPLRAQ